MPKDKASVDDVVAHLRKSYCGRVSFEFEHLPNESERRWFAQMVETRDDKPLTADDRRSIHAMLARSEVPSFSSLYVFFSLA